jgi:hypothetical protein
MVNVVVITYICIHGNDCGKGDGDCKVFDIQPKILEITSHPGQEI